MDKDQKEADSPHPRPGRPSSLVDTRVIYCGDNLDQLPKLPDGCVDLIYIDPPFNSNRNYEVFWGEAKEKRAFEDRHPSTQAYIEFMRPRCVELARVLKKTGSLYYHCDWHASHYVKVMLDQIFGENNFLNEIVWCYSQGGRSKEHFPRKHDTIFLYVKGKKWTFNAEAIRVPYELLSDKSQTSFTKTDEAGRKYKEIYGPGKKKLYRYYEDEGKLPYDWWTDIHQMTGRTAASGNEYLGYPTQKPVALLERIIKASSNPNEIVLDAFCGCGTALEAAEHLDRQWIGIDMSPTACRVMAKRLRDQCKIREDEALWRSGRAFVVRDLPWTEPQLRKIPPFEFENWAVIRLNGIPNKAKVGDMGIDGKVFPLAALPASAAESGTLDFMDRWYPIQVKQKDKAGRPDIDAFEAAVMRANKTKGYFVSFDFTDDALIECRAFQQRTGRVIKPLRVVDMLDDAQLVYQLA